MFRSVYSGEHRTELIQMTVLGGAATAQLFGSNAALLCGPSWAAPHARCWRKMRQDQQRRNHQLLDPDARRGARRRFTV